MTNAEGDTFLWYVQGYFGSPERIGRRRLHPLPFVIGRSLECNLHLDEAGISYRHAEIGGSEEMLLVRDLESTNGTFVNGNRLGREAVPLHDGDVIHVASEELRVLAIRVAERPSSRTKTQRVDTESLQFDWTGRAGRLIQVLDGNLEAWYQPIVDWDGKPAAWEALGRGRLGDLVVAPDEMFLTARENDLERALCRALRTAALRGAVNLPAPRRLFLNAAAEDIEDRALLLEELAAFRTHDVSVVIEIHEAAVVDPGRMRSLHAELQYLGCGLAFDDFGAGHSRLLELTEMKPDYLKFDNSFIQGIDEAPPFRRDIVRTFVRLVRDYGIVSIAEGVERQAEAAFCREAGFELAQGHFFGRPVPVTSL